MIRLRDAITWSRAYRVGSYAKGALWIVPFFAIALELILSRLGHGLDERFGWTLLGLGLAGAKTMHETIVSMTLSFLVFTFGSLLVAIQVASGQLTPRIIAATLLRDNTVRYTVGLFVFTLLYSLGALNRMPRRVSVSHRLCGAPASARRHRLARRRGRDRGAEVGTPRVDRRHVRKNGVAAAPRHR
jgi:uncharacterized membrane protein